MPNDYVSIILYIILCVLILSFVYLELGGSGY